MIETHYDPVAHRHGAFVASAAHTATRFVDVHCHCLPNLDDGPESMGEALALCRALVADNVGVVVATPHQLGRYESRTRVEDVRRMVRRLRRELSRECLDLTVLAGAEVRVDERLGELLAQDRILTLADMNRYILLELPGDTFIDIESLLTHLVSTGVMPIIAHPERNLPLLGRVQALKRWLACGATLQVTAASLTGGFGPQVHRAAWALVAEGWVALVASDAHDHGANGPCMGAAFRLLAHTRGEDRAHLLCVENPSRAIRGERLLSSWTEEDRGVS
jgi:tyrosine-protein phosphatase YwqE